MQTSCLGLLVLSYLLDWNYVHAVDFPFGIVACAGLKFFIGHPEPLDEIRPRYHLYTRSNNDTYRKINPKKLTSLTKSHFNPEDETAFVIHGWRVDVRKPGDFTGFIKDALLKKAPYNVIIVDNHRALQSINYFQVINNNRISANATVDLIRFLMKHGNLKLSKLHLIGHSLGAQHSGYVGHELPGIKRISGLDPAGWCFEGRSLDERLDKTDADFVDIIHTSSSMLFGLGGMGYTDETGHVDFYPNGGGFIATCPRLTIFTAITGILDLWKAFQSKHGCNHGMAIAYYNESINSPCKFTANSCKKTQKNILGLIPFGKKTEVCDCGGKECNEMGFPASPLKNLGHLELKTNDAIPFCISGDKKKNIKKH